MKSLNTLKMSIWILKPTWFYLPQVENPKLSLCYLVQSIFIKFIIFLWISLVGQLVHFTTPLSQISVELWLFGGLKVRKVLKYQESHIAKIKINQHCKTHSQIFDIWWENVRWMCRNFKKKFLPMSFFAKSS